MDDTTSRYYNMLVQKFKERVPIIWQNEEYNEILVTFYFLLNYITSSRDGSVGAVSNYNAS